MQTLPQSVIIELKKILPEKSWSWVIPALSRDAVVINSLESPREFFGVKHLNEIIHKVDDCTPAALALIALHYPSSPEALRSYPLTQIDPGFSKKIGESNQRVVNTIVEAGLEALRLRTLRHSTGSWDDWTTELWSASPTSLACLFGMIPDQIGLIQALIPLITGDIGLESLEQKAIQALIHMVLSNPYPPEVHVEFINVLLGELTDVQKSEIIHGLALQQPHLAEQIKNGFGNIMESKSTPTSHSNPSLLEQIQSLHKYQKNHNSLSASEDEIQSLKESMVAIRQLQAKLALKLAFTAAQKQDNLTKVNALYEAYQAWPESHSLVAILALTLIDNNESERADQLIQEWFRSQQGKIHPLVEFVKETLQIKKNTLDPLKQSYSSNCIDSFFEYLNVISKSSSDDPFSDDVQLLILISSHFSMHLLQANRWLDAGKAIDQLLNLIGDTPQLLIFKAYLSNKIGDHTNALDHSHLACVLSDQATPFKRYLAENLEAVGDWSGAAIERQKIITSQSYTGRNDLYQLAACSMLAGNFEEVIRICTNLIEKDNSDTTAITLLTETENGKTNYERQIEILNNVIETSPEDVYPWMALARIYQKQSKHEECVDVLIAAKQTIIDNPEIYLALAQEYLDQRMFTQALNISRQGIKILKSKYSDLTTISPNTLLGTSNTLEGESDFWIPSVRVSPDLGSRRISEAQISNCLALLCGNTLLELGHLDEANQLYLQELERYPNNLEIAYGHAKVLIAQNQKTAAIKVLKYIVEASPGFIQPYLEFAALVQENNQLFPIQIKRIIAEQDGKSMDTKNVDILNEIIHSLDGARKLDPKNPIILANLAETHAQLGNYPEAHELYQSVIDTQLSHDPDWKNRLALGFGHLALKMGQTDFSIATLLEGNPNDARLQLLLAKAYKQTGLFQEAHRAARAALSLSETDPAIALWYAHFIKEQLPNQVSNIHEDLLETLDVIEKFSKQMPQRADLRLVLGELQNEIGNHDAALAIYRALIPTNNQERSTHLSSQELAEVGRQLLTLNDPESAISCLVEAANRLKIYPESANDKNDPISGINFEIIRNLSMAYIITGKLENARNSLESAIEMNPGDVWCYTNYAEITSQLYFQSIENPANLSLCIKALNYMLQAIDQYPTNPVLLAYASFLARLGGQTGTALELSNKSLASQKMEIYREKYSENQEAIFDYQIPPLFLYTLAGDLAGSLFQRTESGNIFNAGWELLNNIPDKFQTALDGAIDLYVAYAEWLFENNQDISVLEKYRNPLPADDQRLQIIAAMEKLNEGDYSGAKALFNDVLSEIDDSSFAIPSKLGHQATGSILREYYRFISLHRLIAKAAFRFARWDIAFDMTEAATRIFPAEPRPYFEFIQISVLRAEYQRVCSPLQITQHAPGETALGVRAMESTRRALDVLDTFCTDESSVISREIKSAIKKWHIRFAAAFTPSEEVAEAFKELDLGIDDIAAQIGCSREIGLTLENFHLTNESMQHPLVLIQQSIYANSKYSGDSSVYVQTGLLVINDDKQYPFSLPCGWLGSKEQAATLIYALGALSSLDNSEMHSNWQSVYRMIQQALNHWPDEGMWQSIAAKILLSNPQPPDYLQVIEHLEKACTLIPDKLEFHVALGRAYLQINSLPQAIAAFLAAFQILPTDLETLIHLSETYLKMNNPKQAEHFLNHALALEPNQAKLHVLQSEIALTEGKYETARNSAMKALDLNPFEEGANSLLADSLWESGKKTDALAAIDKGISVIPNSAKLRVKRIQYIRQTFGNQAALVELRSLVHSFPDCLSLYIQLALVLEECDELDEAILVAQSAMKLQQKHGKNITVMEQVSHQRLLGRLYQRSGHLDLALYHFTQAMQLGPNILETRLELGQIHLDRRQYRQAVELYQQAIDLAPEDPRAYYKAGLVYKECKDYLNAEKMMRQAVKLNPDDISIQRQLGAIVALNLVHNRKQTQTPNL